MPNLGDSGGLRAAQSGIADFQYQSDVVNAPRPKKDTSQSSPPLRVMLVDDAQIILDRLINAFNRIDGVQVVGTSKTSQRAIELIGQLEPDLVILDISLQESNVWQVLRTVVEDYPATQVFIFSNDTSPAAQTRFLNGGATGFFDKSLDFSSLHSAVTELATARNG